MFRHRSAASFSQCLIKRQISNNRLSSSGEGHFFFRLREQAKRAAAPVVIFAFGPRFIRIRPHSDCSLSLFLSSISPLRFSSPSPIFVPRKSLLCVSPVSFSQNLNPAAVERDHSKWMGMSVTANPHSLKRADMRTGWG